jgi:pantoate--beta-alanine ligase
LHKGHLSLIQTALEQTDRVVVSVYVNPTQFAPGEDYQNYPRQLQEDIDICSREGVAAVFCPSDEKMYEEREFLSIQIDQLAETMCGASREGHFEGVLQVVNKLFNVVQPDLAVFGQKDIQQFVLIRRMVKEFKHDIELVSGEIVRANDGLAISSRNRYLTDEERTVAPGLYRSLRYLKQHVGADVSNLSLMLQHQRDELDAKGFEIDYLNIFDYTTLQPVEKMKKGNTYIIAGAVYLGETRLIDNMIVQI